MNWLKQLFFPSFCVGCLRPGPYLCAACLKKKRTYQQQRCLYCQRPSPLGLTHLFCQRTTRVDAALSLYYYQWPLTNLIKEIKFRHRTKALYFLLDSIPPEHWEQVEKLIGLLFRPTISYVPLSFYELRNRGFNQAEIIAQYLAQRLRAPLSTLLIKRKKTKKQSMIQIKQRKQNINKAFLFKQTALKNYKSILLIDDVITSGATINEAARAIKTKKQLRVFVFSLFRAN